MIVPGVVSHPDQMLSPFFLYYTRMLHEVEGSVLTYVTETEFRKQRSRSPSCNSLYILMCAMRHSEWRMVWPRIRGFTNTDIRRD